MFQIHLWVGIALCLYVLVIGVSGSVLVFRDELSEFSRPDLMSSPSGTVATHQPATRFSAVAETVRQAYPQDTLTSIYAPGVRGANFVAYVRDARGKYRFVSASNRDGRILGAVDSGQGWLEWIADLHFNLLSGSTGLMVNGIGAACLLALCLSGAVIWWPGSKTWKRALAVDFRRRWKRINFDLHSAVGFWTLAILSLWGISGIYFAWPAKFVAAVSLLSPASAAAPPPIQLAQPSRQQVPLETYAIRALAQEPGSWLEGISFSEGKEPLSVMLARTPEPDFMRTTWIYFDPSSGQSLGQWRRGINHTLGDWFTWIIIPLHFGTSWGWFVKVLWSMLGLTLPLLAVTGVVMYWNRFLSKRWRSLR